MAELTGVEPVPADRRSAILPIDHSSGSLPWTRTTISAFRAQRPSIGRRGNFEIVKELVAGERFERPYPDSKSRVLPLDDPASHFQWYRFHASHTQDRRFIDVLSEISGIDPRYLHQLTVICAAIAIQLGCNLYFKTVEFNRLRVHNFGSSEENRTPISALKGPHPGPFDDAASYLPHRRNSPPKTKSPRFVSEAQKTARLWMRPRYMNVPSPAPCHIYVAGVGKQSVWGLRIIACSSISTLASFL